MFSLLAAVLTSVSLFCGPALSETNKKQVAETTISFIDEGYCFMYSSFGPGVFYTHSIDYVSSDKTVAITRTIASNPKGHIMDIYMFFECREECLVRSIQIVADSNIKDREIPTTPPGNCEGF